MAVLNVSVVAADHEVWSGEASMVVARTVEKLGAEVDRFKLEFQTGEGKPLASVGREEFEAIAEEDVDQERIVKAKR